MDKLHYQFIDNNQALESLCESLTKCDQIALDTEFVRERTFYPHAGLIQLADEDNIYLIDPLTCDMTPFLQILENPHICKVMHSMSEDLEVFLALGCYQPCNFFDTQTAASWLGAGLSLSLQKLVQTHTGVELNKSQTRTDWLARPLTAAQLTYAAEDVEHLLVIAEQQRQLLHSTNLIDYVIEDNRLQLQPTEEDHELSYLNFGGAAQLDFSALNRFQRLVAWRERVARRDDRPKPHLIKNNDIATIASECDSRIKLESQPFHPAFKRRYLDEITAVLFEQADKELLPIKRLQDVPDGRSLLKELKNQLLKIATQKGIPEEVMPSKRVLEQIIKHLYVSWYPEPKQWSGWRKSFILAALNDLNITIKPI